MNATLAYLAMLALLPLIVYLAARLRLWLDEEALRLAKEDAQDETVTVLVDFRGDLWHYRFEGGEEAVRVMRTLAALEEVHAGPQEEHDVTRLVAVFAELPTN